MTFTIASGTLLDNQHAVRQVPSPNHSGAFRRAPSYIVMHFTAGGPASGSAAWLATPQAAASAHLVIGRDGTVIQCVSLDNRAWHAGRSSWKGLTGLNHHSIGIELANWGPLARRDESWVTPGGQSVPYCEAAHKNGGPVRGWEQYPQAQIATAIAVAKAIASYHPITGILGHDDIAPGRKLDPGPAFAMGAFRTAVLGTRKAAMVTPATLNVRSGPGLAHPIIAALRQGSLVTPGERQRDWVRIQPEGWVFAQYLA